MAQKTAVHIKHFLQPPSTQVSPFIAGENQLVIANGIDLSDTPGVMRKDLGYSQIGGTLQSGKSITGLHNFRQNASTQKMLATVDDSTSDDTQLFYSTGSTWTEIGAAETAWANKAGINVEMEDFITYCFMVGYGSTDGFITSASLTGTTFSTSTNVTNMPSAKYIKRYRDRLYIANCDISSTGYPYRVYFSSVPSGATISWTVATDFIDVDYSEQITGLAENWDRLIIFTEYSAYMYDQSSKKKVWDVGCGNNRTICNSDAYLVWANQDNVWVSAGGGRPQAIGNEILQLLQNSTISNWSAEVVNREYNLYVGDTSANGISYSNCMLTYSFKTGMWRWREFHDDLSIIAKFNSSGDDQLWLGASDGEVHKKSQYTDATPIYTDDGQSISAWWRTKAYDFGDPSIQKEVSKVVAYCENGANMDLRFRIINKQNEVLMPFKSIGTLKKVIESFDKKIEGNLIQFEGKEYSSDQSFSFYGISILLAAHEKLK